MEQHVLPSPPPVSVDMAAPSRERAARRALKANRTRMTFRCSQGKVLTETRWVGSKFARTSCHTAADTRLTEIGQGLQRT